MFEEATQPLHYPTRALLDLEHRYLDTVILSQSCPTGGVNVLEVGFSENDVCSLAA